MGKITAQNATAYVQMAFLSQHQDVLIRDALYKLYMLMFQSLNWYNTWQDNSLFN